MMPSPTQLIIVLVVVVLLFGAKRFSDLGKGLGQGIRNFKKGISEDDEEEDVSEEAKKKQEAVDKPSGES